jgi:hypothetical protein
MRDFAEKRQKDKKTKRQKEQATIGFAYWVTY